MRCGRVLGRLFGTISGIVTDPSGAVIPGATVKVSNVNTNVTKLLATNSAGVYSAGSLNPGTYKVEAEAKGFKTAVANNIVLEVNANPKVDLTLPVGQTNEVVEVTAANTPILQTQQSDLGQTVGQRQLEQLPTFSSSGRNLYSLLPLYLPAGCLLQSTFFEQKSTESTIFPQSEED